MGPPLDLHLDAAHQLVEDLRALGRRDEADILGRALDIALAAVTSDHEVYRHALVALGDLVCERLDELEQRPEETPKVN